MYFDDLSSVVLAARYLSAISNGFENKSPSGLEQSASRSLVGNSPRNKRSLLYCFPAQIRELVVFVVAKLS